MVVAVDHHPVPGGLELVRARRVREQDGVVMVAAMRVEDGKPGVARRVEAVRRDPRAFTDQREIAVDHRKPAFARNIKCTFYVIGRNVEAYPDIARRIVEEGHEIANHTWTHPQLSRLSSPRVADEILFQLLARPCGDATPVMVETLAHMLGSDARDALRQLIRGRISGARRAATDIYTRLCDEDDLDFALELVDEQKLDLRLSGVELLGAVPAARARQRLCELLTRGFKLLLDPRVLAAGER